MTRRQVKARSGAQLIVFLAGFFITFGILGNWHVQAQSLTPAQTRPLVRPDDMGFGGLLLKSMTEGYYVEAPLVESDIVVDVTGPIARTKITQRFTNPSDGWVEGVYVFPVPDEAAVDTLRMQIGERFIEGKIKERQEARIIYEEAKAQGKKASLIEQERPNIFTNSVANIGPHETITVQIEYQESVRLDSGTFSLRLPLVVAPRYSPAPEIQMVDFNNNGWAQTSDPVPDRDKIESPVLRPSEDDQAFPVNPVSLTVNLRTGFKLGDIVSAHHAIVMQRSGDDGATLTLKDGAVAANKDFELTWKPIPGQTPQAALFRETMNGEEYLLAMVVPPLAKKQSDIAARPREVIFVIDNSGSMAGESIRQAKESLLLALDRLTPDDTFNVIRFDDTMELKFPQAVPASDTNVSEAKRFVYNLSADGGTEMLPALKASLIDPAPDDKTRVRQVIFLTDGAIGNEAQLFQAIGAGLGRSRLFTVGIGSAPNSYFMSRAARLGRGTFTHIGNLAQVKTRMAELFEKLERPVMTDLSARWPGEVTGEVWPNPLPDLYAGEPVVLTAKLSAVSGALSISGRMGDKGWAAQLPLDKAAPGTGISKLWARKKIASLEEARFEGMDWDAVDKAVLAVALDHHLVSRLTSLVAVDVTPSRPVNAPLGSAEVPLNLPDGWDFDKVFGERKVQPGTPDPVDMQRAALTTGNVQLAALAVASTPAPTSPPPSGLTLPQGASGADRMILSGLLTLLLSLSLWFARRRFLRVSHEGERS